MVIYNKSSKDVSNVKVSHYYHFAQNLPDTSKEYEVLTVYMYQNENIINQ